MVATGTDDAQPMVGKEQQRGLLEENSFRLLLETAGHSSQAVLFASKDVHDLPFQTADLWRCHLALLHSQPW